jgi:SH3-like domain-containing protein
MPPGAVIAGVVALLVVLGAACLATPPPTPEVPFSLDARPAPTTGAVRPERVRVVGAGAGRVNLRAEPGPAGARLKGLVDGAELEVVGPDRAVQGRTWRNVRDTSDGAEGWVSAEFLAPTDGP